MNKLLTIAALATLASGMTMAKTHYDPQITAENMHGPIPGAHAVTYNDHRATKNDDRIKVVVDSTQQTVADTGYSRLGRYTPR